MHHHPARMMRERRQTSLETSSTPTAIVDSAPAATATSVVDFTVPTTTKALAVVIAILALIILLGVGICMFRRWKRNAKKNSAPSHIIDFTSEKTRRYDVESKLDLHASVYNLEKPSAVFMAGGAMSAADMNPNWVPQIIPNRGTDLASSKSSSSKKSKSSNKSLRSSRGWDKTFSKFAPSERSPPPSYMPSDSGSSSGEKSATFASQIPLPPSPPHQSTLPPTPPTPPAKKKNPFTRDIPPAKPAPTDLPPLPISPRSASFAVHESMSFAQLQQQPPRGEDEVEAPPRLMNVVSPFMPSLDDELAVQIGETVRILEEFQDGWALVQRVGRSDAPKGVVPQTCLAERQSVLPSSSAAGRRL